MYEIYLYDEIANSFWFGISAKEFKRKLDAAKGKDVVIRVNSPGGDVFEGIAIYNLIKDYKGKVTAKIDGLCASIASVIVMAADEIVMPGNTMMMIHDPWTIAMGDSAQFTKLVSRLEKTKFAMISSYKSRMNVTEEEISQMMQEETWFNAPDAIAIGLADKQEAEVEIRSLHDLSRFKNYPKGFHQERKNQIEHRKISMNTELEKRTFQTKLSLKAVAGSQKIVGEASVFNQYSEEMFGFREVVRPGAFDEVLKDDVRGLFNHDHNIVLGRTKAGTLRLTVSSSGLNYEIDPPDTQQARDLMVSIERGDIDQSSFSFHVAEEDWQRDEQGRIIRFINKFKKLYDVGPVTFGAYTTTQASMRNLNYAMDEFKKEDERLKSSVNISVLEKQLELLELE